MAFSGGTGENCPVSNAACRMEDDKCLCTLEGVSSAPTPDPPTPPPPSMPTPPGWAAEPDPSGGGDGGGGDGSDCHRFGNCGATVELGCDAGVMRGQVGGCELTVDPPATPLQIDRWWFAGAGAVVDGGSWTGMTWEGPLVRSGQVRVEGKAAGVEFQATSFIQVGPRTGSEWSWSLGSGITYAQGGVPFPSGSESIGRLCRADVGCSVGGMSEPYWLMQPLEDPLSATGYTRTQVDQGGPNHGLWFVTSVSTDVQMASTINPDYLQGGTEHPDSCAQSGLVSFWEFNQKAACSGGGPSWAVWWHDWVWGHEGEHALNVQTFVANHSQHVVPAALESAVASSWTGLHEQAKQLVEQAGECINAAAATHAGFSGPSFDIWDWVGSSFTLIHSGGQPGWWPSHPVPGECL